jgi:hypothetical protein
VSHIDDFLYAGTDEFSASVISKLCERFQAGSMAQGKFRYVGYTINQTECAVTLDQCKYIESIDLDEISAHRKSQKSDDLTADEKTEYRSLVGSLNWIAQGSRPDLSYTLIDLSTKFKKSTVADLIQVKQVIHKVKLETSYIRYPCLGDMRGWKLLVYTDASHGNLCEGTGSCMGYTVFVVNDCGVGCLLAWKANKIDRVVRSTIAAEVLACVEGIEEAIYIKQIMMQLLSLHKDSLPIIIQVDHRGAVDAFHSTKLVKDRRLRIDIASVKECLERGTVSEVRHCFTEDQLADCLTKKGASGLKLRAAMENGAIPIAAIM